MKKRQIFFLNMMIAASFTVLAPDVAAQKAVTDSLIAKGDRFRETYRFEESAAAYSEALATLKGSEDSTLRQFVQDRLLLAENGRNMTGFAYSPVVVARHMFSLEDFFLYYPLKDRSWRKTPNQLDSLSGPYARAIYAPAEDREIYYSAADQDGIRNIYKTSFADTLWTLPDLLNEQMTSVSDEIYPMLSQDGKYLYFASDGLYGVGGYDLYVSEWDQATGDWSVPVNLGFPYSSPANDFLLVNSSDGRYTFFASDRGCPRDSVYIYVLEYDSTPVRSVVGSPEELMRMSRLEPSGREVFDSGLKSEIPENVDTRRYMDGMALVRSLRDSIALCEERLADCRGRYSRVEDESQKKSLEAEILEVESLMPGFKSRLDEAVLRLQEVEMEFLFNGVVIDPDKLLAEADRELVGDNSDYIFSKMSMGEPLTLEMQRPEPKFDYSFKILEVGQFAEDNTIPSGVVYQIQIFSTTTPASVKSLKGLSPVFESRSSSGRYVYRVGLFNTYSDVLSHLNKVKRLGFRGAYIVGYVDGKEASVKKVRATEAERKVAAPVLYNVRIVPDGEDLDDVALGGIRQQSAGKDIARIDGAFIVGPFDSRKEAGALVEFVRVMGYGSAELNTVNVK